MASCLLYPSLFAPPTSSFLHTPHSSTLLRRCLETADKSPNKIGSSRKLLYILILGSVLNRIISKCYGSYWSRQKYCKVHFIKLFPASCSRIQFIEYATRQDGQTIGHGLQSCTSDIRTVKVAHPTGGRPVVFVDTPGFDDTYKSDIVVLSMIADWLVKT
jgi:hypothetical protein